MSDNIEADFRASVFISMSSTIVRRVSIPMFRMVSIDIMNLVSDSDQVAITVVGGVGEELSRMFGEDLLE